jgi:hypothetical protein
LSLARLRTDFGKGFYLTPVKVQACSWAERFHREKGAAILSIYEFFPDRLPDEYKVLNFISHDITWLNFITACRLGNGLDAEWDMVSGGVANDKVFDTLQLCFDNLIGAEEAIGRLRYRKPNFQYCLKSQALIDEHLRYLEAEERK